MAGSSAGRYGGGDRAEKGPVVVIDGWSVDLAAKHGELVA
jgi:hypothetical protein